MYNVPNLAHEGMRLSMFKRKGGMADVSQACGVLLAFGRSSKDVREQAWSCGGRIARTT